MAFEICFYPKNGGSLGGGLLYATPPPWIHQFVGGKACLCEDLNCAMFDGCQGNSGPLADRPAPYSTPPPSPQRSTIFWVKAKFQKTFTGKLAKVDLEIGWCWAIGQGAATSLASIKHHTVQILTQTSLSAHKLVDPWGGGG